MLKSETIITDDSVVDCRVALHLSLSRNHILHLLFSSNRLFFHIDTLIIEMGGIFPGDGIKGKMIVILTNLCKET
jgi:hypothetical protein